MAAKRSQKQLAPMSAFIESLFEIGGYSTWKEFADDADITPPQVSEFKTGVTEPAGLNLLRLIEAAARRAEEEAARVAGRALPPDPLAILAAAVEEIGEMQQQILQLLTGRAVDQPSSVPAAPKQSNVQT